MKTVITLGIEWEADEDIADTDDLLAYVYNTIQENADYDSHKINIVQWKTALTVTEPR